MPLRKWRSFPALRRGNTDPSSAPKPFAAATSAFTPAPAGKPKNLTVIEESPVSASSSSERLPTSTQILNKGAPDPTARSPTAEPTRSPPRPATTASIEDKHRERDRILEDHGHEGIIACQTIRRNLAHLPLRHGDWAHSGLWVRTNAGTNVIIEHGGNIFGKNKGIFVSSPVEVLFKTIHRDKGFVELLWGKSKGELEIKEDIFPGGYVTLSELVRRMVEDEASYKFVTHNCHHYRSEALKFLRETNDARVAATATTRPDTKLSPSEEESQGRILEGDNNDSQQGQRGSLSVVAASVLGNSARTSIVVVKPEPVSFASLRPEDLKNYTLHLERVV